MIELEFADEQYFLDINWYFSDFFNRLCVVASGGGKLPKFLFDEENQNNEFNNIVNELPERFESARNENILDFIIDLEIDKLNQYFENFDSLARKGFYVYDKINLSNSEQTDYILVAYPIYNSGTDSFPINPKNLKRIPKITQALISRTNESFSNENFEIIDLISLLDNQKK